MVYTKQLALLDSTAASRRSAEDQGGRAQVRAMHALDHKNILKFYAWCGPCFSVLHCGLRTPLHHTTQPIVTAVPAGLWWQVSRHRSCII